MDALNSRNRLDGADRIVGWSALGVAGLAVLAWAACCVLPLALSLIGLGIAGTALIAGLRGWLTFGAGVMLAAGWWSYWRRRRVCSSEPGCTPPSRLTAALLGAATLLVCLALIWQSIVEPWAMRLLMRMHT